MSESESVLSVPSTKKLSTEYDDNEEIQKLREYLRIRSIVSPDYDYVPCIQLLKQEANKLDLPISCFFPGVPTKPIVIMEWEGTIPALPKIVLNSHMDVVPVFEEQWTHPPFDAEIDEKGRIFARGTQDTKCSGMQHLAAIRALKCEGVRMKRTVLIMFAPDEETGSKYGMKSFVNTKDFKNLNIGFFLDEGLANEEDEFFVYFAERAVWRLRFKISGTPGHAALLLKNTAAEKLRYLLDKFMDFRAKELKKLESDPNLNIGDVTALNLTIVNGGIHNNVIPSEITLMFDCRLTFLLNQIKFEAMIRNWMEEAGGGIELVFIQQDQNVAPTKLENSPFWNGFKEAMDELKLKIRVTICPGATDSRFLRPIGIPAIGFSALNNTTPLAHDHDEFVTAETYLKGIEIWKQIIRKVADA